MFQIVEAFPRHCSITDGIIGTEYKRHPMTYHRLDSARAIAGLKHDADYRHHGDSSFFVIEAGAPVINRIGRPNYAPGFFTPPADDAFDDCPF